MSDRKFKALHITHNDADALGCALVYRLACVLPKDSSVETHFCSIGEMPSKVIIDSIKELEDEDDYYDEIIVSDISISLEAIQAMEKSREEHGTVIHGFDHHISNHTDELHDWFIVENRELSSIIADKVVDVSAAELMLNAYNESIIENLKNICSSDEIVRNILDALYFVILSISRYDTWTWMNDYNYTMMCRGYFFDRIKSLTPANIYADDFYPTICNFVGVNEVYIHMIKLFIEKLNNWNGVDNAYELIYDKMYEKIYLTIKNKEDELINNAKNHIKFSTLGEYITAEYISFSNYDNAIIEYYKNTYQWVDIFIIYYPSSLTVSYRTTKDDINLSRLTSRIYGGGGHMQASGAKFVNKEPIFLGMLEHYYTDAVPVVTLEDYIERRVGRPSPNDIYRFLGGGDQ